MSNINELSFETAYAELETIVNQLTSTDTSLEDTVKLYERGRELSRYCQGLLDKAELRITRLDDKGGLSPQN